MAKPEWGSKRLCSSCGARFYDLQRDPILCPKCGAEHDPLANVRQSRSRTVVAAEPKAAKPAAVVEAADEEEDLPEDAELDDLDEDEEDDDLIEDASELGEEDDVIDVSSDEEDKE